MRSLHLFIILGLMGCCRGALSAEGWLPAKGPLKTHWADDVNPGRTHPEYPRPQLVRKNWVNLNGLWDFAITRNTLQQPEKYDSSILVPFPVEAALSGVMQPVRPYQRVWYRRKFNIPRLERNGRLLLHFGAVDWSSEISVNGKVVGRHQGGYDPFTLDITSALKPGKSQELIVRVDDPTESYQPHGKQSLYPKGRRYTAVTGIWQTVWLEAVPAVSVEELKLVPDVPNKKLYIIVTVNGMQPGDQIEVSALDGKIVVGGANADANGLAVIDLPHAKLWTPETPFLYDLKISIVRKDIELDSVTSYFGMRQISIGKDDIETNRLMLNGNPYYMVGLLDQGYWPDGLYTAPTDEAMRSDLTLIKRLGFNMIRKHMKVEPATWYAACDRLGLLVWQDMPGGGDAIDPDKPDLVRTPESANQYRLELSRMIETHQNAPSIIMWILFNGGMGQFDTEGITQYAKKLDPTRLVDSAGGWADRETGDVIDQHSYPDPDSPRPGFARAAVLGEYGGLNLAIPEHTWSDNGWGYQEVSSKAELTSCYVNLQYRASRMRTIPGLSASVYTQLTDVETECNGLMTYDREVLKVDRGRVYAANHGDFSDMDFTYVEERPSPRHRVPYPIYTEFPPWGRHPDDDYDHHHHDHPDHDRPKPQPRAPTPRPGDPHLPRPERPHSDPPRPKPSDPKPSDKPSDHNKDRK